MMKKVTLTQLLIDHGVPRLAELFDEYKVVSTSRLQERDRVKVPSSSISKTFLKCNRHAMKPPPGLSRSSDGVLFNTMSPFKKFMKGEKPAKLPNSIFRNDSMTGARNGSCKPRA